MSLGSWYPVCKTEPACAALKSRMLCCVQPAGQAAAAAEHAGQPLAALRQRIQQQQQQAAGQIGDSVDGRLAAQGLEGRLLLLLGMLLLSAMAAATASIVAPLVTGLHQAGAFISWGVCLLLTVTGV